MSVDQGPGPIALVGSGEYLPQMAELEAGLDFSEEDIEFISRHDLVSRLTRIDAELQTLLGIF